MNIIAVCVCVSGPAHIVKQGQCSFGVPVSEKPHYSSFPTCHRDLNVHFLYPHCHVTPVTEVDLLLLQMYRMGGNVHHTRLHGFTGQKGCILWFSAESIWLEEY